MKLTRILLVLLAVFFIASIPLNRKTNSNDAQAQPSAALSPGAPSVAPPPAGQSDPPGTIDGSKNPELIPDTVAYRLVLLAIAEPENASDAQKARFRAKIGGAQLGEDDIQMLLGIVGPFQNQMDALTAQANQILARDPLPVCRHARLPEPDRAEQTAGDDLQPGHERRICEAQCRRRGEVAGLYQERQARNEISSQR